jgi:hypothetical protein
MIPPRARGHAPRVSSNDARAVVSLIGRLALSVFGAGAVGCGADDAPLVLERTVTIQLARTATTTTPCAEERAVRRVEARALAASGVALTPEGWPAAIDCATSAATVRWPETATQLEVVALGEVQGDVDVPLFRGRVAVDAAAATPIAVLLEPEVAFIGVEFAFERDGNLEPCAGEVDDLQLYVATEGSGRAAYRALSVACAAGGVRVPVPLYPLGYVLQLDASAPGTGQRLYSATETRFPEKGWNASYKLTLTPIGGRVSLDWEFDLGTTVRSACDDPQVGVGEVTATLVPTLGGDPLTARLSCVGARPARFPSVRFGQGTELQLRLEALGVHHFLGKTSFRMPAGDATPDTVRLLRVGTASVSVAARSEGCVATTSLELGVKPTTPGASLVFSRRVDAASATLEIPELPYGDYLVELVGRAGGATVCNTRVERTVAARRALWEAVNL